METVRVRVPTLSDHTDHAHSLALACWLAERVYGGPNGQLSVTGGVIA